MSKTTKQKGMAKVTPLMKQYLQIKTKYPDAVLLFRVGDFYETFGEDAIKTSKALGIILTSRNNGGSKIELAGFPHHSMDLYLPKLVKAGYRVAVCEQLEKPSPQKKIVKRGVTEIVTPGVTTDENLLDHKSNNYLASVYFGKKGYAGVSFLDVSTGELLVSEGSQPHIEKLLQSFSPSEVIFSKDKTKFFREVFGDKFYTYQLDEWIYTLDYTREKILTHFGVQNLKGFGIEEMELAQIAAGASLHYLDATENKNMQHINTISRIHPDKYVWLDRFSIRNLELIYSPNETGVPLVKILDKTITPMGARLMKKWTVLPLKSEREIKARLDIVDFFYHNEEMALEIKQFMRQIGDLERLISKVPLGKVNPRETVQLKRALEAIVPIKKRFETSDNAQLKKIGETLNPCLSMQEEIKRVIVQEPPHNLNKGGVIADGTSKELDEYRSISRNSKSLLVEIQQKEAKATGIANLKIGFNNVFGYYLEVTNKYKHQGLVPPEWTRKQTLTNAERYITDELKKLEVKILEAEERILTLEQEIFADLLFFIADFVQPVQHNAALIGKIDALLSFAAVAKSNNYVKPEISDSFVIDIKGGRHPVIEQQLEPGDAYVPNDTFLDNETQQILMITGPNMSGKSAVLRQTALICLMAQMGSYVPATAARLGVLDKVFTRVGASDNISSGESTFMVEMNETASIMNNISDRSLILLDEIGRGTSTYDGISIAWSIAEYLHQSDARPKTLFATHYHELNELANKYPRVKNYNIATKEVGQKVIFLRKLVPGGSKHSFGIHVAKMAGMPRAIVERAAQILSQMEQKHIDSGNEITTDTGVKVSKPPTENISTESLQLSIFETYDPFAGKIKEELLNLDINVMSPIDCMMKLVEMKKIVEEEGGS